MAGQALLPPLCGHDCPQFLYLLLLLDCVSLTVSLTVGVGCLGLPYFVTLFTDSE